MNKSVNHNVLFLAEIEFVGNERILIESNALELVGGLLAVPETYGEDACDHN